MTLLSDISVSADNSAAAPPPDAVAPQFTYQRRRLLAPVPSLAGTEGSVSVVIRSVFLRMIDAADLLAW